MKIITMNNEALKRIPNQRAFLADVERQMDKLYGVKQYAGPVLFDHKGFVENPFDKKQPWERMYVDTGREEVVNLLKGEIDDDA